VLWKAQGWLTIKGITQPVKSPADVQAGSGIINLKARLTLDKTLWGLYYHIPTALGQQLLSQVIQKHFNLDIDLAFAN
jgi:polyisoprenoid-binding protein YceI